MILERDQLPGASSNMALWRRTVGQDLQDLPNTLSSWDHCMAKAYCKWPVIVGIIVGSLVVISVTWCCIRCCCRRRKKRPASARFSDPVPQYGGGAQSAPPTFQNSGPPPPQFAYFETGAKNNDDLPVMPTWNGAKSEKIENPDAPKDDIELKDVDHSKQQQNLGNIASSSASSSSPPNHSRLGSDPQLFTNSNNGNRPNGRSNNSYGSNRTGTPNMPGPNRMGTPGNPNRQGTPNRMGTPGIAAPLPNRMNNPQFRMNTPYQSPPPSNPTLPYGASHDDGNGYGHSHEYNPHINHQNQGPYANVNADMFPSDTGDYHTHTPQPQPQRPQYPQNGGSGYSSNAPVPYPDHADYAAPVADSYDSHVSPPNNQAYGNGHNARVEYGNGGYQRPGGNGRPYNPQQNSYDNRPAPNSWSAF